MSKRPKPFEYKGKKKTRHPRGLLWRDGLSPKKWCIEWEAEASLPEVSDLDYDHMLEYSKIVDGVRRFPFITVYSKDTGEARKIYLGA